MKLFVYVPKTSKNVWHLDYGAVHIKKVVKKGQKIVWNMGDKKRKIYFAKLLFVSHDPKKVKIAFENLSISLITFHRVIFALCICATHLFFVF